jgi:hypothetical protein
MLSMWSRMYVEDQRLERYQDRVLSEGLNLIEGGCVKPVISADVR